MLLSSHQTNIHLHQRWSKTFSLKDVITPHPSIIISRSNQSLHNRGSSSLRLGLCLSSIIKFLFNFCFFSLHIRAICRHIHGDLSCSHSLYPVSPHHSLSSGGNYLLPKILLSLFTLNHPNPTLVNLLSNPRQST